MSAGIIIVLIIVVWLFVLAPLLLRGQRPIRKAGKAFNDTRVLHEGGSAFPSDLSRRLRPRSDDVHYEAPDSRSEDSGYEVVAAEAEDATDRSEVPQNDVVDGDVVRELEAAEPAPDSQQVDGAEAEDAEGAPADEGEARTEGPEGQQASEAPEGDDETLTSPEDMLYDGEEAAEEPEEIPGEDPTAETVPEGSPGQSDELTPEELEFAARRRGRGGWDPVADPDYARLRYQRRQRVLLSLLGVLLVTVVVGLVVGSWTWWLVGAAVAGVVAYLVALRRQVRQEEELRRRRIRQLRRARLGVRHRDDEELDVPRQLRRLGALVVEIDDESPDFVHLSRVRLRPSDGDNGTPESPAWRGHKVAG